MNKFSQLGKLSIDSVNYGNGCFEPYRNKNKDKPPAVSEKANQAHQFSLNHSDNYNRREAFSNEVKDKAPIPMRNNYIR